MRLKSSEGRVRSWSPTRLVTSSAPEPVSRVTRTSPGGLNARTYATASASSTVWSISSKGMPTSAQSAVRASARLSVDGSDCDREPARDNVIPCNVNYYRRSPSRALPAQGRPGARRGHREVIGSIDQARVVEQRTCDATHALTVFDCDRLGMVDGDSQRPS